MKNLRLVLYKFKRLPIRIWRKIYFLVFSFYDDYNGTDFYGYNSNEDAPELQGLDSKKIYRSTPSGFLYLGKLLRRNKWISKQAVLDIGCGKGSAMRKFHKHGFKRVAGIEINEHIFNICRRNFDKINMEVEVFNQDAINFDRYLDYSTYYLYNPFPCEVFELVINRIIVSQNGNPITIIYSNTVCHELLIRKGFSMKVQTIDIWGNRLAVYTLNFED